MLRKLTTSVAIVFLICTVPACARLAAQASLTHHITLQIDPTVSDRAAVASETVAIIERRLDLLGLSNFKVVPQGNPTDGRIMVSLPDVSDLERITSLITAGGRLELVAVVSPKSPAPFETYKTREEAAASLGGKVPNNRKVLAFTERTEPRAAGQRGMQTDQPEQWVVVEWPAIVDGKELSNAAAIQLDKASSDYWIGFSLKPSGAEKFGAWTAANINHYLAVVLNDEVKSIAFIKSQIFDQGAISGRFTKQSAEDLALVLTSGALPAPVKIVSKGVSK